MADLALISFGCSSCLSQQECGGIPGAELFGCFDHCNRACRGRACDFTCPNNPSLYFHRWQEVSGKGPVELSYSLPSQSWPVYMPTIYSGYMRESPADAAAVAIPLSKLFRYPRETGRLPEPVAGSATELRMKFKLRKDCRILALGVDEDYPIERFWHFHRTLPFSAWLTQMGIEAATAPNFSYLGYAPREHYLWNRKRVLLFSKTLGESGLPIIPHLYGDTRFDWFWWAAFYRRHPQIDTLCLELQTGDAETEALERLMENLSHFRENVGRPLSAIVVGGRSGVERLAPLFSALTVVEATPYMKTARARQFAVRTDKGVRWRATRTVGTLDALLNHNVRICAESVIESTAKARGQTAKTRTDAA